MDLTTAQICLLGALLLLIYVFISVQFVRWMVRAAERRREKKGRIAAFVERVRDAHRERVADRSFPVIFHERPPQE